MDVLIKYIGDVGNGYYQTINQIISYVFLAQAGFSDAVIYSLYKPFAEKNKDDINAIYGGARKVFRIIGFIILGIIFLVTLGLHLFYNFEEGYKVSALICFFIISTSYLISYFGKGQTYMAVSKGLKGLHLAELAAAVGISKPYFYTFFDSLEDFSLQMMEEQRCRLLRLLEQELARPEGTWEEHVESFFRTILRHRENGILVMTQGEEADLHSRLTPERFQDFRPGQRDFFLRLMALLDIRQEDCAPEVLANLVFSCLLIYNSAPESMPFLFPSHLEETAALHVKFLVNYLGSLRNAKKDR